MIEQFKFTSFLLGKAFAKQTEMIKDQGEERKKAIQDNKNSYIKNKQVIMNYCFQRKEKYLRIFTTKDSIK